MSTLVASPRWAEMEYDERCRRVWQLAHQGLNAERIADALECRQSLHLYRLARSEGIVFGKASNRSSWPSKETPGLMSESADTVRMRNWQYQHDGARRTRLENEFKDRAAPYLGFHTDIPTNNTDLILGSNTSQKPLAELGEPARGDGVETQELFAA